MSHPAKPVPSAPEGASKSAALLNLIEELKSIDSVGHLDSDSSEALAAYLAAPEDPQEAAFLRSAVINAADWIASIPHGDNCHLDPDHCLGADCHCGKEIIVDYLEGIIEGSTPAAPPAEGGETPRTVFSERLTIGRTKIGKGPHEWTSFHLNAQAQDAFYSNATLSSLDAIGIEEVMKLEDFANATLAKLTASDALIRELIKSGAVLVELIDRAVSDYSVEKGSPLAMAAHAFRSALSSAQAQRGGGTV